jgi:hypothetical protein
MRRSLVATFAVLAMLGALPASADHPGWYTPSPESQTANMHIVGSSPRTRFDSTYRNSDLAFWGRLAYAGHYDGFRILNISDPENPETVVDYPCPGVQHDISVWAGLLFLSIDTPRTGPTCDSTQLPSTENGFEGIRVFDVKDPANPVYVTGVPTDCGSHTHTLVPDPENGRVLLYVASYPASHLGPTPFGTECTRATEERPQGHSQISVVEVPLATPQDAAVIGEPQFTLNDRAGIAGYRGCHDITVFMELNLAASACLVEGQIWDISDPEQPTTTARVHNSNIEFWHSAAFTWDGERVVFGDEAGGGTQPRCRDTDPATLGAAWIYDVGSLDVMDASTQEAPLGSFKIPRPQGAGNCTTHNFNFIPTSRGYFWVSSYYAGGTTVVDMTNAAAPREVGHLDPHGANTWSSYWYNGFIYTNDSGRGSDVMLLSSRVRMGSQKLPRLNPQTQESTIG